MLLTGIIIFLVAVITYFLFMPVHLMINTDLNEYYLKLYPILKASFEGDSKKIFKIKLRLLFLKFNLFPLDYFREKSTNKKAKKKKKNGRTKIGFKKIFKMVKAIKVKKLFVNVDTGDCIYNSKLFPFVAFLKYHFGNFNINFKGRNSVNLHLQCRSIDILKTMY